MTLGGDRTPKRSGHARATRPAPPSQGHPTRGRKTVSGGTKKHPKLKRYKSPTPSLRRQRADAATKRALLRSRRALSKVGEPIRHRDTDTHIGPINIEAELEGRGVVAKYAKKAKKIATSGTGQTALKSAGVVPSTGNRRIEKNFTKDIIDAGAQAVPSAYAVAAGAKEAAQGRPQRIKKVAKTYVKTDPVALAAQGKLKEAAKQAEQHPGLTALSAYGTGAALSRGAGAAVRAGSHVAPTRRARRVLRKAGNTKRAPRVAPGTGMSEQRTWSKGLAGKAVQVANERRRLRKAHKFRKKAAKTHDLRRKQALREEANKSDPRIMNESGINRRVDEREGMAHARQQRHRSEVLKKADKALPKKHAGISLLKAQGMAGKGRAGLEKLRRELDAEFKRIPKEDRARRMANRALRKQVDAALKDKKLDLAAIDKGAKDYAKVVGPLQKELVKRGVLSAEAERKAKLVPYAVKEMGAKPGPDGPTLNGKPLTAEAIEAHIRENGSVFRPPRRKTQEETGYAISQRQREFEALPDDALVQVYHGKAGAGAGAARDATYVTLNYHTAKSFGLGKEPEVLFVRKGDLEISPETRGFNGAKTDVADTLFGAGEAVVPRGAVRFGQDDPDLPVYVTQAPGQRGAKNFFFNWKDPRGIRSTRRTGEAARQGTFEVSREVGRENVARMQGLIDAHNEYAGMVSEQAYRGPRGKGNAVSFDSREAALDFGRKNLADSPYEWTAVPTRPQFGRKGQSEALLAQADAMDVNLSKSVRDGIVEALEGKSGSGKWVLVPAAAAKRMSAHTRLLGSAGTKVTRKMGRQFSGTVLTTSGFTWPLGNVAEASLRSLIKRAGPTSWRLGHKTIGELRKFDPEMADELQSRIGTGHLGAYELNHVHSTAKDFQGKVFLGPVARASGAFFRAPGPKQVAQLWNAWTHYIFAGNGMIEHQFRTALLGRYLRDQGYSPHKMLPKEGINAISKAAEEAAQGMRGTNAQVMAGRYIDRAYGKYSNFSPEMRFTIAVFTPFVAWSLNAVKFLTSVLPKDHPILTGALASAEMATEEWRKQFGLGKFIDGAAPNWMQASIPVDGKLVPVGRYTPFGFWADPLETSGSLVLPAIGGIQMASKGLDWKGDPLPGFERGDDVPDEVKALAMAQSAARSMVPFFGLQEKVRDKGAVAVNPLRGFSYNKKISAAYNEIHRIDKAKDAIEKAEKKKGRKVDSDHPTPAWAKLHLRERKLNELIFKESKGKYGQHYKEPYQPSGAKSSGGGGWDQYRSGAAPKAKSGWDAYR